MIAIGLLFVRMLCDWPWRFFVSFLPLAGTVKGIRLKTTPERFINRPKVGLSFRLDVFVDNSDCP
jgi:hypothetical protein